MELQITKIYRKHPKGVQAPKDVMLTIPKGMFALLVPKGAGKSMSTPMLATLQEPDLDKLYCSSMVIYYSDNQKKEVTP
ncbi:P-loop NTPase family protein [Pontibacter pamirensis]|uniref:hypothetical protein n=1 Tax=Pontibacter pamirensis TaxID=2562824 RepID=UPI001389B43E|nr:hypothetical protein [Pontibacter pamirensis]